MSPKAQSKTAAKKNAQATTAKKGSPKSTDKTKPAQPVKTPKVAAKLEQPAAVTKPQPAVDAKPKKLGCIDAAAQVLAEAQIPMTSKELIAAMAAKNLWTSPAGQTPHATLYSAILREISGKGSASRFVKADKGKFAAPCAVAVGK